MKHSVSVTCCALLVSSISLSYAAEVPSGTVLAEKQELVRHIKDEPASLDPAKAVGLPEIQVIRDLNRPGFPGECFICELRLPDHRFRWKHNKLFLLLPEEYGPAFPAIVDCYTSPPT